jgi:hypothetical protein
MIKARLSHGEASFRLTIFDRHTAPFEFGYWCMSVSGDRVAVFKNLNPTPRQRPGLCFDAGSGHHHREYRRGWTIDSDPSRPKFHPVEVELECNSDGSYSGVVELPDSMSIERHPPPVLDFAEVRRRKRDEQRRIAAAKTALLKRQQGARAC